MPTGEPTLQIQTLITNTVERDRKTLREKELSSIGYLGETS